MVATYSPHRLHGGPSIISHETRTPSQRHLSDKVPRLSPLSASLFPPLSPFVKPKIQTRRFTPNKSRNSSPYKLALHISSDSSVNSSSNSSSSDTEKSPVEKHTSGRHTRSSWINESKSSPMKRRETTPVDQGSISSPKPKRRAGLGILSSPETHLSSPVTRSTSNGTLNPGLSHTPKRSSSLKRVTTSSVKDNNNNSKDNFEKPLYPRSTRLQQSRNADFTIAQDTGSRLRKMQSFANLHAEHQSPFTNKPLLNPSIHTTKNNFTLQNSQATPSHPLSQSIDSVIAPSSQGTQSSTFATPQNYKNVRPLQTAFMSTGLISKRNRPSTDGAGGPMLPPDTPCKRPVSFGLNKNLMSAKKPSNGGTPFPGDKRKNRLSLVRRESTISVEDDNESICSNDSMLPPTPTKRSTIPNSVASNKSVQNRIGGIASATRSKRWKADTNGSPLGQKRLLTPRTPHDAFAPPDPSSLSISGKPLAPVFTADLPHTPTGSRDYFTPSASFTNQSPDDTRYMSALDQTSTPQLNRSSITFSKEWDFCLENRFAKVDQIGTGEFSVVFKVTERPQMTRSGTIRNPSSPNMSPQAFAVKRIPYNGFKDREQRLKEVEILKAIGSHNNVVRYMDTWEDNMKLYIQTEFCDFGSLDMFLAEYGNLGRLDPFRIWKILAEITLGLEHIHNRGYIHLDLKPANILIASDGTLKIADFGMATKWPANRHLEREGDREYIAPEVLARHAYDKPADVYSLGLILLEVAGNIQLPDNGPSWQKLRNGDLSEVPDLSVEALQAGIIRDDLGFPIPTAGTSPADNSQGAIGDASFESNESLIVSTSLQKSRFKGNSYFNPPRTADLDEPPEFMKGDFLEPMIAALIAPEPTARFSASQILRLNQLQWIIGQRKSGAIVYEGEWGQSAFAFTTVDHNDAMECSQPQDPQPSNTDSDDWMILED